MPLVQDHLNRKIVCKCGLSTTDPGFAQHVLDLLKEDKYHPRQHFPAHSEVPLVEVAE